jgi:hypothetical protein
MNTNWMYKKCKNRRIITIDLSKHDLNLPNMKSFHIHPWDFRDTGLTDLQITDTTEGIRAGTVQAVTGLYQVNLFRAMEPGKIYQYVLYWNWGEDEKTS